MKYFLVTVLAIALACEAVNARKYSQADVDAAQKKAQDAYCHGKVIERAVKGDKHGLDFQFRAMTGGLEDPSSNPPKPEEWDNFVERMQTLPEFYEGMKKFHRLVRAYNPDAFAKAKATAKKECSPDGYAAIYKSGP